MLLSYITLFFLALGLAMDAFAVSLGYGVCFKNSKTKDAFRLSLHTALFQIIMPLIGWLTGNFLGKIISKIAPFIAFFLLIFIGIKMIIESFNKKENCNIKDISRGKELIIVCIATSIDAFAAGISLGLINLPLFISLFFIGIITFLLTFIGVFLGKIIGLILGKWAEISGGIILIIIGIKILINKIFS